MSVQILKRFLQDQKGATAIEYGMLAALVAVGAILAFGLAGDGLSNLFGANAQGAGGVIDTASGQL